MAITHFSFVGSFVCSFEVAVCGLPEAVPDHHIVMSLFARDCLAKMGTVTKDLEMLLGVGTADLGLRVGLHSGPVTAGVLRGERARFQVSLIT